MDSVEISGISNSSNDPVNIGANSEDIEDDFVVRRKSKINILLSDDDDDNEDGRGYDKTVLNVDIKEAGDNSEETNKSNLYKVEENDKVTDSMNEIVKPSSDCFDSLKELADFKSTEMNIRKNRLVVDDKSEVMDNNNDDRKSVNSNIGADPENNSTQSSHSSKTKIIEEDEQSNEEKSHEFKSKRFTNILDTDSDSEDERKAFSSLVRKKIKPRNQDGNDSRSSSPNSDILIQSNNNRKNKPGRKTIRVVNSESEDEEDVGKQREVLGAKENKDVSSSPKSIKPNKISVLVDTDSEDDIRAPQKSGGSSDNSEPLPKSNAARKKEKVEKKKKSGSIRSAKEKAMHEIHSESQRMLRESQIRLPYHKPKQRTLQEFLNRRKALPTLPATLTTAVKVKISGRIVGKVMEEKEKEAELFYKSSDSDNETSDQSELAVSNIKPKPIIVGNEIQNNSAIEETQKLVKNQPQNSQTNKEAIQQGDESIGVPKKLFNSLENEIEETEAPSAIDEDDFGKATKEDQACNQEREEFRQGLKDISVSRKLFESECVKSMDVNSKESDMNHEGDEIEEIQEINETVNDLFVNNPKAQTNESIEEEAEDFELKMSEDPYEMITDNAIPKTDTKELESTTVAPFINNRDVPKLNEGKGTDSGIDKTESIDVNSSLMENKRPVSVYSLSSGSDEDSKDKTEVIDGHVYGLPLSESDDDEPVQTKPQIFSNIMKLTPKLQGTPDMVIELSPPKGGINQLIQRFLNHSVVKKQPESSPEVVAVRTEQTANGLKVIKEVLPYRMPINEKNDDPELSKPGAKLTRLKEDLQQQMAMQRNKEWKQKELEMKTLEADDDVYRGELSDCGMEEEEDDEEKEEEDEEGETEPEEDDLPIKETKNKYKSPFVDAEAEVSGEESEEKVEEDEEDKSSSDSFEDETEETENNSSKLKRIVKAFEDDDSNDAEVKEMDKNACDVDSNCRLRRTQTDIDMFATDNNSGDEWLSDAEDELPVYQQRAEERSQACATPLVGNNSLSIVSPITQLTALNTGLESGNTDSCWAQNSLQFIAPLSVENTPLEVKSYRECDSEKREKLQQKLFDDFREPPNDSELMSLCSGKFSQNPIGDNKESDKLMHTTRKSNVSDAELMDLCSGTFATQQPDVEKMDTCREKVVGHLASLIDSAPPSPHNLSKEESAQKVSTSNLSKVRIVFSSDDENDVNSSEAKGPERNKKLKKKVKKLELSDDEEEEKSDTESFADFDEEENEEDKFVEYDSEENEIVVPKKDIRKVAARFLDEEAELSESEWGSADEDERDLDKLDLEEGDLEDIDQDQVKNQLERIHMRQVLDADQREVRLLQEILLEDGELHSDASRQRKFKWKNIDDLGHENEAPLRNEDDQSLSMDPNDIESELEWRKKKLEREQFLQEQRSKEAAAEVEEEKEDSQLFQLGIKALKKNKSTKVPDKDISQSIVVEQIQASIVRHTVADLFASPGGERKTFALQNAIRRGSFLARGEESLARLSVITKQNSDHAIIRTKKSRNFVFAHLSPAVEAASVESEALDDQENTNITDSGMRKRKPAASLTPTTSKKSKKEYEQSNTRHKLFN